MPVRKENPICPYCKKENSRLEVLGISGVINTNGMINSISCWNCNRVFEVETEVTIKFTTRK